MRRISWVAVVFLATTLVMGATGPVQAAPTVVSTLSGNIGEFRFTNVGMNGSTATINFMVPNQGSAVNTVNGQSISPEPIKLSVPFTFTVTPLGGGNYSVGVPSDLTQTIGVTAGQQAVMGVDVNQGNTPVGLPNFFNVAGPIKSLLENNDPNYDFKLFGLPGTNFNLTFTATTFSGGNKFSDLFTTVGATAVGNGSFSQAAVPEPGSVILMGLGLAGVVLAAKIRHRFVRA